MTNMLATQLEDGWLHRQANDRVQSGKTVLEDMFAAEANEID